MKTASLALVLALVACSGAEGPSGTEGVQGVAGPQGSAGPQGPQGVAGPQGALGPQGSAGAVGPAGPPGSRGANWVGGWSDLTRYQVDDAVDHQGASYVAVELPVLGLPPPGGAWQLVAAAGQPGPQGPQGLTGATGPEGPAGLGTVNSVETGPGLTGGPIIASGTIAIAPGGVTNDLLSNSGLVVTAGEGLTGGGLVSLGGAVTLGAADLVGDVSGPPGTTVVSALQGHPVAPVAPADGQLMAWSAALGAWVPTTVPPPATYRYAVFETYDMASGWMANNDPSLFGGVPPSSWTDGNAVASSLSADKDVLRTLFTRKGHAQANALVHAETFFAPSSTNGRVAIVLLRVRNVTASAITWTPVFRVTAYGAWGEMASLALNGAPAWSSGGAAYVPSSGPFSAALAIPAGRTSTVILVATGGPQSSSTRPVLLAFTSNSLRLPAGLAFVDDLDTATGGWEQ